MPDLPETIPLEHVLDVRVELEAALNVGATPFGRRAVLILRGGEFEGPRLRGRVRAGGGDWVLFRGDGTLDLDVRATLEGDGGALIYLRFSGLIVAESAVFLRAASGQDVRPDEYTFRVAPRFETATEPYGWLNNLVCAGSGWIGQNAVGVRIFALR